MAVTLLHLSLREMSRMSPGLFFDMVQIHTDRLGKKPDGDFE